MPLGKETRHKEKKGKLPVEGALVHEAAHAPASELALAGWLAGEGHAGAIAELNWGCWVGHRGVTWPSDPPVKGHTIETTIERDKKGGFGVLPLPLIVLCGGFP